jgi:hypothetical protein
MTSYSELIDADFRQWRARFRHLVSVRGACWMLSVLLAAILIAGWLDFLVRPRGSGWRWGLTGFVLAAGAITAWRVLIRPLRTFVDSAWLARVLEQLAPHSPAERSLAAQRHPSEAAEPLLQAVSRTAASRLRAYPSHHALRGDAYRFPLLCLGLVATVATASISLGAVESLTALTRLAVPWRQIAWPQHDWLVLVDEDFTAVPEETSVDATEPVRWYVLDERGSLPDELWLQIRHGGTFETRRLVPQTVKLPSGMLSSTGLVELLIEEPVAIRVIGGDDRHMPWVHIAAYRSPRVVEFAIETSPPAYSGLDRTENSSISGHIECLVGSRIEVVATFDQPLKSATLIREGHPSEELELLEEGQQVRAAWTATAAGRGRYQFEVVGSVHERRSITRPCEVHAIGDEPPTIAMESPRASMFVTESAAVPIRFTVEDDLAVDQVAAAYSLTMSAEAEAYSLITSSERMSDAMLLASASLEPGMLGAMVGDRISVWGEATDFYNLGPAHSTRGDVRTLSVVTEADKLGELNARLEAIVTVLKRLEGSAAQSANLLAELQIQVETAGHLRPPDLEIARKLLFDCQTSARDTYESESSLHAQVGGVLLELEWNNLQSTELQTQLTAVDRELVQLRDWDFPALLQDLSLVAALPYGTESTSLEMTAAILRASQTQRKIADVYAAILGTLGEFRRFGSLSESLARMKTDQEAINLSTLRAAESTLGRDWSQLSAQQQADLQRLAERQSQLAATLSAVVSELQQSMNGGSVTDSEQLSAEIERRLASHELRHSLEESSALLSRNELGSAMPVQQAILEEFSALQDLIAGRSSSREAPLVALHESLQALSDLLADQRDLLQEIVVANESASPGQQSAWADRQMELSTETGRLLVAPQSQGRDPWIQAGRRAILRMRQGRHAIMQGDWGTAQVELQEAVDDLTQTVEHLRVLTSDQQHAAALGEVQRLPRRLQEWIDSQTELLAQVQDLDAAYSSAGQWNRDLLRRVREIALRQQALSDEISSHDEQVSAWPAFRFAIHEAVLIMRQAAENLDDRRTGEETQDLQQHVVDQLGQVLSSLVEPRSAGEQPGAGSEDSTADHEMSALLVQVRLLRNLQAELRIQTEEVVRNPGRAEASQDRLASRQRRLADLAEPLLEAVMRSHEMVQGGNQAVADAAGDALLDIQTCARELEDESFTLVTVTRQGDVVSALDRILEKSPPASLMAEGSDMAQQGESQSPGEGESTSSAANASAGPEGDPGTGSPVDVEVQQARDRELASDVWGHLPPRAQQQMNADFSAEFLPEYDDWIRRYYEALAEER